MSNQYVFELTDEQTKAIKYWTTLDQIQFHADGLVSWIEWRDYDVRVFTFRKDGTVVLEERDFNEGWSTYTFDAEGAHFETV